MRPARVRGMRRAGARGCGRRCTQGRGRVEGADASRAARRGAPAAQGVQLTGAQALARCARRRRRSHLDGELDLGQIEVRLGHGDRRPNVQRAVGEPIGKDVLRHMTPRVERNYLGHIEPRIEWADAARRQRVGKIGSKVGRRSLHRQRDRAVNAIGATVSTDRVAHARFAHGRNHRPTLPRIALSPIQRLRIDAKVRWVRGQLDEVPCGRVDGHNGPHAHRGRRGEQKPAEVLL